ncbi:hypothetical protein [Nocardia sp. NPDC049149]|uniref:hypothetical protein n=1 Tax=Nocardia sp. NPDC049149 TaxID=3364315 RepID=UPI00371FC39B
MKHMKGTVAIAGMAASLLFAGVAGADAFHTDLVTDGRTVVAGPGESGGADGGTKGGTDGGTKSGTDGDTKSGTDGKAGDAPKCDCTQKGDDQKGGGVPGLGGGLPGLGGGGMPGLPGSGKS